MDGLLEHWQVPEGERVTFTNLTTSVYALMANHDRMPVTIKPV